MKVIDKELMIERDKTELIMNERNILVKLRHKRVVRLHYAF
jgi:protein kinase A